MILLFVVIKRRIVRGLARSDTMSDHPKIWRYIYWLDEAELKRLREQMAAENRPLNVATKCSAANRFFVLGPSGYVRVCNHSEHRLLFIRDWKDLKHHEYWKTFVMKRYLPGICGDCNSRTGCDAGCREAAHIVGGSIDSPDPILDTVEIPVSP